MNDYLKIPTEMANFALTARKVGQVQCYTASHFMYSGKARISDNPAEKIALATGRSERTVYRYFHWLLKRNWFGRDKKNGWFFFRGFDRVHKIEDWKYKRAVVIQPKDLQNFKAFLVGTVLTSLIETGKGAGTEHERQQTITRSRQSGFPIPISSIKKVLNVSRRTAITYRNLAKDNEYLKMDTDYRQVVGITADNIKHLKQNNIESVMVNLFGSTDTITIHPNRFRWFDDSVRVQLPNLITSRLALKKR